MEFASESDALAYFEDKKEYYVPENLSVENGILIVVIKDNQANLSAKPPFYDKNDEWVKRHVEYLGRELDFF